MAEKTKIQWTDHTFNPWWGCHKLSPACDHCYAETLADTRYGRAKWGPGIERTRLSDENWRKPLGWNRNATKEGVRRRVFCGSMCDVFEGQQSEADLRERLWKLIEQTPHLDWLLLTKRPSNVRKLVPQTWLERWPENVWVGTTVENQEWAEKRLKYLLDVPARYRFVSVEPMLGPVDLRRHLGQGLGKINWVICGGESGAQARGQDEMIQWYRDLRDQCDSLGVPFFFKQWGAFREFNDQLIRLKPKEKKSEEAPQLDGVVWQQWPVTSAGQTKAPDSPYSTAPAGATHMKTKPRIVEVQTEYDTPNTPPDCYRTADLPLAAYLRCQNVHLRSIGLVGRRAFFVFQDGEYCLEMAKNWANEDDCEVSGPVYSRELSKLKALAAKGSF